MILKTPGKRLSLGIDVILTSDNKGREKVHLLESASPALLAVPAMTIRNMEYIAFRIGMF